MAGDWNLGPLSVGALAKGTPVERRVPFASAFATKADSLSAAWPQAACGALDSSVGGYSPPWTPCGDRGLPAAAAPSPPAE